MEKEEYNKNYKPEDARIVKEQLDALVKATPEQREAVLRGVNERYLKNIESDLRFWISMFDYCNHIKFLDYKDKKPKMFVTTNDEFIKFIEKWKKASKYLNVVDVGTVAKAIDEIKKEKKVK